jgi:hypothetical protein
MTFRRGPPLAFVMLQPIGTSAIAPTGLLAKSKGNQLMGRKSSGCIHVPENIETKLSYYISNGKTESGFNVLDSTL